MAAKKKNKRKVAPIPRGYSTVTASLNQTDAKATIAFCKKVFGAKVGVKMPAPGGKLMHAELHIGDSIVMLSDAVMDAPRVGSLFLYVQSVDKIVAKALKAGATLRMPVADQFWGDRMGSVVDPQGNIWAVATHIENVPPVEMKKRMKIAMKQLAKG